MYSPYVWPTTRTDLRKHGPKIPTFGRQIPGRLAMPDQINGRGMSYTCRRWQGRKCTSMPVTTWLEPSLSQEVRMLFIKILTKSYETFCIFPWALHSSPPSTIYDSCYDHPNRSSSLANLPNSWIASCQLVAWIDWDRYKSRIDNILNTTWIYGNMVVCACE